MSDLYQQMLPTIAISGVVSFVIALVIIGGPILAMEYFNFYEEYAIYVCVTGGFAHISSILIRNALKVNVQIYQAEERLSRVVDRSLRKEGQH